MKKNIEQSTIVNFLKNYGFVFANSEIYNGLANAWDYGPLGVLLRKNIKDLWWKRFVTTQSNIVGLDSSIIYNPLVWKASGHIENFSDPLIDCKECKIRLRADKLIEDFDSKIIVNENEDESVLLNIINKYSINSDIDFIIGGANGLPNFIIKQADFVLSFGKMVYPHLMVRVMLIEQLYRVHTINNNHPYHK